MYIHTHIYVCVYIHITVICICIYNWIYTYVYGASLVAQMVKNLPAIQETQVRSLGQEDPPGEDMPTHSSIPAWRIPWTEEPGGLQFIRPHRVRHNWRDFAHMHTYLYIYMHTHIWGFPGVVSGKEPTCQCRRHRNAGSIPGLGAENPFQYSCLEHPMDRGA